MQQETARHMQQEPIWNGADKHANSSACTAVRTAGMPLQTRHCGNAATNQALVPTRHCGNAAANKTLRQCRCQPGTAAMPLPQGTAIMPLHALRSRISDVYIFVQMYMFIFYFFPKYTSTSRFTRNSHRTALRRRLLHCSRPDYNTPKVQGCDCA
jgi:hypothetical protein